MPRPIRIDMDLDDVDPNGVFQDQTTGGAADMTLNGAGVTDGVWTTPDGFAKRIGFESSGNISGVTFTITGFADKQKSAALSETITGPNADTVETTNYFYSITQIAVDGAVGTNTEAGPVDEAVSATIPVNWRGGITSYNLDFTGTADVTVEQTFDDVQNIDDLAFTWQDSPSSKLVNATASTNDAYEGLPTAVRTKFNSYSSGARVITTITQRDD